MFNFLKRLKRRKEISAELKPIEENIVSNSEIPKDIPVIPDPPKRFGIIKFCSTHGTELPENRVCAKCAEVALEYGPDHKDPLNNDMDQNGMHGDHFDKRVNQNRLLKDDCKEKPANLLRKGYFCHKCEVVLWHRLNWCPRCGTEFNFIKMSNNDMGATFPNYIVGY